MSNEKFGNRSSENVPLNLNLLVSISLSLLVSFSFQYLVFGFYFYSFTVTLERNSVCCILFHFPYSVFDFALLSLYPYLLIRYKFVLRHFTKNAKRRSTRLQSVMYSYRAQVTFSLGAFTIESHHGNENIIKIIKLD